MPLPPAAPDRQLKHHRSIDVQVYARADRLWEVDARLTDVKSRDAQLATGVRPAGEPIHHMLLRLVVDEQLNVVAAGAQTLGMPYLGHCEPQADAYAQLAGLNLLQGFRAALRQRLGGVLGCTHLTELAQVLPTAVIQAFAGEVIDTRAGGDRPPFQIDRCRALRSDGDAVRLYYPRWYRPAAHNPDVAVPADAA